jgi:hypothetical protein
MFHIIILFARISKLCYALDYGVIKFRALFNSRGARNFGIPNTPAIYSDVKVTIVGVETRSAPKKLLIRPSKMHF